VGIPGELAGLWEAHQRFGKVPWSDLVRPAKDLAQNGFAVSPTLAKSLEEYRDKIMADPVLRFVSVISFYLTNNSSPGKYSSVTTMMKMMTQIRLFFLFFH
jgi:gamma-glutamyltranspeptidase